MVEPRVDIDPASGFVYVCAPFRNATHEERVAVAEIRRRIFESGLVPVWGPALLDGIGISDYVPEQRERALTVDLKLLRICGSLVLCGAPPREWRPGAAAGRITSGMLVELRAWLPHGQTFYAGDLKTPLPVLDWLREAANPFSGIDDVIARLEHGLRLGKGWPT